VAAGTRRQTDTLAVIKDVEVGDVLVPVAEVLTDAETDTLAVIEDVEVGGVLVPVAEVLTDAETDTRRWATSWCPSPRCSPTQRRTRWP